MKPLRLSTAFLLLAAFLPGIVSARQVAVYPPTGSGPITIYSQELANLGFITGPPAPVAVLSTIEGTKYYVISRSATATLTIATAPLNGTGVVRNFGEEAQGGAITYDGRKLIVLTSNVRIFDTTSDNEIVSPIYAGSLPNDVGISPDSRYAYVLSPGSGSLTQIDLSSYYVVTSAVVPSNATAVTVAPNGTVYVSGEGRVSIYDGRTLSSLGQITLNGRAGRLSISPNGRYALTPNVTRLGSSLMVLDLLAKGVVSALTINAPDASVASIDNIEATSNSTAYAFSRAGGRIYSVSYPQASYTELVVSGSGLLTDASGLASSLELPASRNLYYVNSSNLSRLDLTTSVASSQIPQSYPGAVTRLGDTPSGTVTSFQLDSDGAVIPPGTSFLLVARALDSVGAPVRNAYVTFSSNSTGVTFLSATSPTSAGGGYISVLVQAPSFEGAFQVNVSSGNVSQTFNLRAGTGGSSGGGGGTSSGLVKIQGDGQLGYTPSILTQDLIVEARDANGIPVSGVPVTWSAGADVYLNTDSYVYTDEKGRAKMRVSLTAVIPASNNFMRTSVSASTATGTVNFSLVGISVNALAPSILLLKPEGGTGSTIVTKAGTVAADAVAVGVATISGVPIPGVGLSVSTGNDPASGPTAQCEGITALTNDNGRAACNLVAGGRVGTAPLTVNVGGAYSFELQIQVQQGDPASIKIIQGNGQSGSPGALLPVALAGTVLDSLGSPLVGVPVTWEISPAGSATLVLADQVTASNGRASTQVRLSSTASGAITVRMRSGTVSATFNLSVVIPLGALVKVSGDGQGPVVTGQSFPNPLVVQVNNTSGQPVANVAVAWQVTGGSATLSSTSTTTDSSGRAQVTVTAGATAGSISISASVSGLPAVSFSLSSRLPGPVVDSSSFTVLYTNSVGLAAGGYSVLTGKGLAPNITGTMYANTLSASLPTTLANVRIQIGLDTQNLAPIYAVSNVNGVESVVFITPIDTPAGTVNVTVRVGDGSTTASGVPVRTYAPAFMETTDADGNRVPLVIRSDGYLVSAAHPARRGESLIIYAIGLGQTNPQARTNVLGAINQALIAPLAVGFGSAAVTVPAYMSQQFISVYEIVVTVPDNADLGSFVPLGLQIAPAGSGPYYAQDNLTIPITTP